MPSEVKKKHRRTDPYDWIKDEILHEVIRPRIMTALREGPLHSKAELLSRMNDLYSADISPKHLNEWLESLDITLKNVLVVEMPQQPEPAPSNSDNFDDLKNDLRRSPQNEGPVLPGRRPV